MNIDPSELKRRRDAFELFTTGVKDGTPQPQYTEDWNFTQEVWRITIYGNVTNDAERAIQALYVEMQSPLTDEQQEAERAYFTERYAFVTSEPLPAEDAERRQVMMQRHSNFPIPPEIVAIGVKRTESEHAFISAILDHFEEIGGLPERLKATQEDTQETEADEPQDSVEKVEEGGNASAAVSNTKETVACASLSLFPIQTSQEWDVFSRSAADGKSGRGWHNDMDTSRRIFDPKDKGLTHYVILEANPSEIDRGREMEELERLTAAQNADGLFAFYYIAHLLTPKALLPAGTTAVGWVDLDDVAKRIDPNHSERTAAQRAATRREVYNFLLFGSRARTVGKRSIAYHDKVSREIIPTEIESPLWSIQGRQMPVQPSLMAEYEVPRAVEVTLSREWLGLLMRPDVRQFINSGELLGSIPPGKAAGAWARAIGLALAVHWRMKPREATAKQLRLTRRELLTRYTPKIAPAEDLLNGTNPKFAVKYWSEALGTLADSDFIEREGEAAPGVALQRLGTDGQPLPRQGWAKDWLDTEVLIVPGPAIAQELADLSTRKIEPKPKPYTALGTPKKRGRPAKAKTDADSG